MERLEVDVEIGGSYHEGRHHFSFPLKKLNIITEADDNLSSFFIERLALNIQKNNYSHYVVHLGGEENSVIKLVELEGYKCEEWLRHPKGKKDSITRNIFLWSEDLADSSGGSLSMLAAQELVRHIFYCAHAGLFYVLQPETHIHPKRIHIIADLCARLVNNGVQVFVYTNCNLLFSSFRVLMKRGVLKHDDCVCFFSKLVPLDENGEELVTEQIDFGSGGKPSRWPHGFFDFLDDKMDELLGWQRS